MARSCCCRCVSSVSYRDRQLPRGGQSHGQHRERLCSEAGDGLPEIRLAQTSPGVSSLGGQWQRGSGKESSSQPMARAQPRLYLRLGHLPIVSGHPLAARDHLVPGPWFSITPALSHQQRANPERGTEGPHPSFERRTRHTYRHQREEARLRTGAHLRELQGKSPARSPQPLQLLRVEPVPAAPGCPGPWGRKGPQPDPGQHRPAGRRPVPGKDGENPSPEGSTLDEEHPESGQSLAQCPVAPGRAHGAGDAGSPGLRVRRGRGAGDAGEPGLGLGRW